MFILSDSPPEKDVQWSEEGIDSSFRFIQKLWNLNLKITNEIKKDHKDDTDDEIIKNTNKFLKKITNNLENFSYNKIIANLHELYSFLTKQIGKPYRKNTLTENYQKILITMMPIIPHFSNECLKLLNAKDIKWPNYDELMLKEEVANIVIQINGKKRGLIQTKLDISEKNLFELVCKDGTLIKYLKEKDIKRKIYIKDKLMNIII